MGKRKTEVKGVVEMKHPTELKARRDPSICKVTLVVRVRKFIQSSCGSIQI